MLCSMFSFRQYKNHKSRQYLQGGIGFGFPRFQLCHLADPYQKHPDPISFLISTRMSVKSRHLETRLVLEGGHGENNWM